MKRWGQVTAQVTGKYGNKGHGLEIPAVYIFAGYAKDTMKLKKLRTFKQFCGVLSLVYKELNGKKSSELRTQNIYLLR